MKHGVVAVILIAAIVAVDAAPANDVATTDQESECFECHGAEGTRSGRGGGPAMQNIFRIFMHEPPLLETGASTLLDFQIRNWWTAEMRGFNGYVDISGAPALSFEATKPPVHGSKEGELPDYDAAAYYQNTERSARTTIDVPTGGTDLSIRLAPKEGAEADLILRVWTPDQNPAVDTPVERDVTTEGEEIQTFRGDPITGGRYTIEVAETPDTFATPTQDMFDGVGFDIAWTLEYQFEPGATTRNGGTLVVLDGQEDDSPQHTRITWPVNIISNITTEQHIRVYMESVGYYDHPPQFRAVDEWLFWASVDYYLVPQDDGIIAVERVTPQGNRVADFFVGESGVIEVDTVDDEPVLIEDVEAVELDVVSEIVGYIAAFLLVISLLTGGAFGNWSRRLQQWMVYRRGKKRVAFHNVVSYGLILAATLHMVLFLVEPRYPWSVGFFLGGVSIVGMFASGFTGAFQRPMVRGMSHEMWRWTHYLSFVLAFAGAAGHMLLDGIHFADLQAALEWQDPVAPWLEQIIPVDNSTAPANPPT